MLMNKITEVSSVFLREKSECTQEVQYIARPWLANTILPGEVIVSAAKSTKI